MNTVQLMGNLTRDIEIRDAGGTQVGSSCIANNRKFKTASGEKREETAFVDIKVWGRTAENMAKFFKKGDKVLVEGRLTTEKWQDKDGNNRSKTLVVVQNFHFVDSGNAQSDGPGQQGDHHGGDTEDDLPF